jgi:hypothetical protein
MGKASVIHQVIISTATAITRAAFSSSPNGLKKNSTKKKTSPAAMEIVFLDIFK